jgi:tetratricopeptide (TPR) repeat protein
MDLGIVYELRNETQQAAEVYKKILTLHPDHKQARNRLGQTYIKEKKLDEALTQFRELQKLGSGDLNIRTKIGLIYLEQGKLDQAILEFNFVLGANPEDDRVRYYLGAAYVEKGALDLAIAEFKKIPVESDLFADSRRSIVLIFKKQNKTQDGFRLMEESIQAKPKDPDLYLILAALYEQEEQLPRAVETLKKGLVQNSENIDLHYQLSALYDKMGDFEKMVSGMREVLRLDPNHADALNYLGYSYTEKEMHLEEALRMIQKAMTLRPNMGYIMDSLGWAYFKLGDYARAVEELEKANQLTPNDPVITEHLADGYSKLSRTDKAKDLYQKALTLNPKPDQMERLKKKIEELKEKQPK